MIHPIQDRVLVKPAVVELSSVIFVQNKEKFNQGTVVAVGPGKIDKFGRRKPLDAKPGDRIRYGNGTYLDWPIVEHEGELGKSENGRLWDANLPLAQNE